VLGVARHSHGVGPAWAVWCGVPGADDPIQVGMDTRNELRMEADPYRAIVEKHFRVYENRAERLPGGTAHLYFLMFPDEELETRFNGVRKELLEHNEELIVFMRRDGGEDILVLAPRAPVLESGNRVNWILLGLTMVSTILAGAMYWQGYKYWDEPWTWTALINPEHLWWGFITLALPLMAILGLHETAHYIAARKHGLRASLPYFIPFPPIFMPIGTLGAFIKMKDPMPDRKALFDVGASGPIAGLVLAIPILLLGVMLTDADGIEVPDRDRPLLHLDAQHVIDDADTGHTRLSFANGTAGTYLFRITAPDDDWSYTMTGTIRIDGEDEAVVQERTGELSKNETIWQTFTIPGNATSARIDIEWEDGLVRFGDPLLVKGLQKLGVGGGDYLTHPTYFAGWIGLFVTGLNLIPASQLDGGHVARAVFGERMKYAAYAAVGVLFYLSFEFTSYLLFAVLIMFMGVNHPPPLNERVKLGTGRTILAVLTLVILLVTFIPAPFIF
jgi:membrane-associated protease RseP (regulator of RpoE activity)